MFLIKKVLDGTKKLASVVLALCMLLQLPFFAEDNTDNCVIQMIFSCT